MREKREMRKEQEMLKSLLDDVSTKELVVFFKALAAAVLEKMEQQDDLKGTWSHEETFSSFKPITDVYRFVSLLQCSTVRICTSTVRMPSREKACLCGGL